MHTMTKRLSVLVSTGLLFILSVANAAVEIEHDPLDDTPAGSRVTLSAEIKDDDKGIELARAYFKTVAAADYVYAEMNRASEDEDTYVALLPAPAQDAGSIEYFFLARNGDGEVVKSQNFAFDVTADETTAAALAALPPRDVVLEPSEFADVDGFHGRLLRLSGDVQIVDPEGRMLTPAEAGFVVRESQTISTGADGLVVVDFEQDPITVLDNHSRLNVRAPSWFTHLAGKAYFAFKRLVGVTAGSERVVANTVALIGIRGTTFISYENDLQGVALKDGAVNVTASDLSPMQLQRNGTSESVGDFLLDPSRMAMFEGARVSDTEFNDAVRADFKFLEGFAAGLLGAIVVAEQQARVEVHSESPNISAQVNGFDDFITLNATPQSSVLGIGAASSTVVAGAGLSTAATLGIAGAAGLGVAAVADSGSGGGGGGGGGSELQGSDGTVRVNLSWSNTTDLDLEVVDPCDIAINFRNTSASCQGFNAALDVDANAGGPTSPTPQENIAWPNGAPTGSYIVTVTYFASPETTAPPTSFQVTVSRDFGASVQTFSGTLSVPQTSTQITVFSYP